MPENKEPEKIGSLPGGPGDKEKKGAGAPPPFSSAASKPPLGSGSVLKLRGLNNAGSVLERLKQLRKKDLIFIASGLAVLLLAPLAEHLMLSSTPDQVLKPNFDRGGTVGWTANPYESGTTGIAPGGLPGQTSDIITPLNVRDPSSLVLGFGAQQAPAAPPSAAGGAPSTTGGGGKEDWKNALAEAGRQGASRAAEAGGLPGPKGALSSQLRGFGALGGGAAGPTYNLPPISPSAGGGRGGPGTNFVASTAAPGYGGVAGRSSNVGGNLDALKRAAQNAGDMFNRVGSAGGALQAAANTAIPTGGLGAGGMGEGSGMDNKFPGGNQSKGEKNIGESLAYLRAKMNMERELELYWKKKGWYDFERTRMMQEEILKAMISGILAEGLFKPVGNVVKRGLNNWFGIPDKMICQDTNPPHEVRFFDMDSWGAVKVGAPTSGQDAAPLPAIASDIQDWQRRYNRGEVVCVAYPGGAPPEKKKDEGSSTAVSDLSGLPQGDIGKAKNSVNDINCSGDPKCDSDKKTIMDIYGRLDTLNASLPFLNKRTKESSAAQLGGINRLDMMAQSSKLITSVAPKDPSPTADMAKTWIETSQDPKTQIDTNQTGFQQLLATEGSKISAISSDGQKASNDLGSIQQQLDGLKTSGSDPIKAASKNASEMAGKIKGGLDKQSAFLKKVQDDNANLANSVKDIPDKIKTFDDKLKALKTAASATPPGDLTAPITDASKAATELSTGADAALKTAQGIKDAADKYAAEMDKPAGQ